MADISYLSRCGVCVVYFSQGYATTSYLINEISSTFYFIIILLLGWEDLKLQKSL